MSVVERRAGGRIVPRLVRHLALERRMPVLVAVATTLFVIGCASRAETPDESPADRTRWSAAVAPGDAVRIQVWREADLSGIFTVDDRGIVTLPLLGQRDVSGLSPSALRDSLASHYARYLLNPAIEVTLLRRINILGEVRSPGLYPVDATISLADAIALAGGVTAAGDWNKVQLVRGDQVIMSRMGQATTVGATAIRSGDQVVVGERSWLARNSGVILGSVIAASAIISAALISK